MESAPGPGPSSEFAQQPCFLGAISSAIPSGVLGWVFGFVPSVFRQRHIKHYKLWLDDASKSGQNLMVFSGVYALTHCIITRIRQVDDAFNRGAAGCATGLAIGWGGGPASALQSCIGIGMISYVLDFGSVSEQPAKAAFNSCCSVSLGTQQPIAQRSLPSVTAAHTRRHAGPRGESSA